MKTKFITLLALTWTMLASAQFQYAGIYGGTVEDTTYSDINAGVFAVFVGTNGQATVVGYDVDSFQNYNGQSGGVAAQFNVAANGNWNFSSNNTIFGVSGSGLITNGYFSGTLDFTNGDTVQLNGNQQSPLGNFQNAAGYYSGTFSGNFGGQAISGPLMGVLSANGQITFSVFINGALNDGGQGQFGSNNQFTTTNTASETFISGTLTNATLKIGGTVTNIDGNAKFSMSRSAYVFQVATTNLPAGVTTVPYSQTLTAYGGPTNYTWGISSGGLPAGLSLSGSGVISGTPTTAVTTNFTVRATNALSATATQALSLVIYAFSTNVTFTVSPAAVSNTYSGTITLQASNLASGETVVVQKFLDANTNGVIDGNDWLAEQFTLTDGQASVFYNGSTPVTNLNVPCDMNSTTGAITAVMNFQNGDFMRCIIGKFLFKLCSPVGHFTPITNVFTVTNFPYAQKITGTVVSNSLAVPYAVALLFGPHHGPVAGAVANNSGSYTIAAPAGTYSLMACKSNYLANYGAMPVVTLTNTQTITTNLMLTNATVSISGKVVDATNSSIGLPGILLPVKANNGLLGLCFTDTNGNFTVRVQSGQWSVKPANNSSLIVHGYAYLNDGITVNTTTGSVTNVTISLPKGMALVYGNVSDTLGNPLPGLTVYADDSDYNQWEAAGYTGTNGNYFAAAPAGDWWVEVESSSSPTNYVFPSGQFLTLTNGQAVLQNFTAILATNHIIGTVKDNNGNPIVGVGVWANATINGVNYRQGDMDTDTNGNYFLNVANSNLWSVGIETCSDCNDGLPTNYLAPANQTIGITNNNGLANFTVQTNINVGGTLQVTTAALPNGTVGAAYDQQLTADGGQPNPSYSWSLFSGSLPPELSMDSGGTIQGTPTFSGTTNFTVQVSDNNGSTATQALSLTIYAPLQVTTTSLSSGTTNVLYNNQQLTASGGQPPYSWSLASGALPSGLSLSTNGVISGTPTTAGTSNFVVQVTDSALATATQALSLVVYTFSTSVTFTVTPSAVSNFYNGIITLQVGGLVSGETVLVEKFRDNNGNGVIDAKDTEVQQFQLTDGQASVFYDGTTAVTNFNVPGDLTPADGAITAQLYPALSGVSQLTVAQYAFRLSSPVGHFAPITNLFNVTNSAYAQSFTGNVVCSGTNVPHALAYLFAPYTSTAIAGALADATGAYRLNAPPGTYQLWTFKSGFVGDFGNSPVLALGANATISTNLSLLPATCSISGRFVDAANTNTGLPRVNLKAGTANNLVTVGFADGNGNFTLSATTNWWVVWGESQNLDSQGVLGLQSRTLVNTTTGSVAGLTVALARGTALVYGTVKDGQNNPLSGVRLSGNQNDSTGPYVGDATTDENGNYAMAVNDAGVWNAGISGNNPAFPNYVWSAGLGDTTFASGQAVRQDFIGTVMLLTAPARLGNGEFQFIFNTTAGTNYTILATTNVSLPLSNWFTVLVTNVPSSSAFIQDNHATNSQRFYRVKIGP